MATQSEQAKQPDKDRPRSLPGFCVPRNISCPQQLQHMRAMAWVPYIQGRDLAREVTNG